MFIGLLTDIVIAISIYILVGISIEISIDVLTDKEEGGGRRKEGVDFFLKAKNPTSTGGEHKNSNTRKVAHEQ